MLHTLLLKYTPTNVNERTQTVTNWAFQKKVRACLHTQIYYKQSALINTSFPPLQRPLLDAEVKKKGPLKTNAQQFLFQ